MEAWPPFESREAIVETGVRVAWGCHQCLAGPKGRNAPPATAAEMRNRFLLQGVPFPGVLGHPWGLWGVLSPKGHVGMTGGTVLLPRLVEGGAAGT